jgi:FtsH-binding integral membrane protein
MTKTMMLALKLVVIFLVPIVLSVTGWKQKNKPGGFSPWYWASFVLWIASAVAVIIIEG